MNAEILSALTRIEARLNEVLGVLPTIPKNATDAEHARVVAKMRGFYTVKEFAAVIGRHAQYVSDRCAARVIKTLRGEKPYRIPLSEEKEWNEW